MTFKPRLTIRLQQVLDHMAQGHCEKETGRQLGIATKTIKHYRGLLYQELHAKNAPHAVALAYQWGLLKLRETPRPQTWQMTGNIIIPAKKTLDRLGTLS